MPHYPQLASGSVAQYPLRKRLVTRTVVNDALDGSRVRYHDPSAALVEWTIEYRGLTTLERDSLEGFFRGREGQLEAFVFPDPAGNLLARSEQFDQAPWANGPLLQWTGGAADPFGGTNAMRLLNAGTTAQSFGQQIDLPGDYQLCLSLYLRSDVATSVILRRTAGAEAHESLVAVPSAWRRFVLTGSLATTTAPVTVEVEAPAGATVDVFGAQLEPQPAPSAYRRTTTIGGVHGGARFAQDELDVVAEGVDSYAARVKIRAAIGG